MEDHQLLATAVEGKVQLLNKRVQDKKTEEIFRDELSLDEITDIMEISECQKPSTDDEFSISILATMKSIAHTVQSKARWAQFAAEHDTNEEIYTFSSKGDFSKVGHVTDVLTSKNTPKHIVMCTNMVRFKDLSAIVKYLETHNPELKRPRKLRLYFDELDKYIDSMRPLINEIIVSDVVSRLVIVTATPQKIWQETPGWEKLFVLNPRVTDSSGTYLMFKDCTYFDTDKMVVKVPDYDEWLLVEKAQDRQLIEQQYKVLLTHPEILKVTLDEHGRPQAGVIFAPGNVSRESHDLVAGFWNHFGCASAVVNGKRTTDGFYGKLILVDKSEVDIPHMKNRDMESRQMKDYIKALIKKNIEANPTFNVEAFMESQAQLNDIIADLYHVHNLYRAPLVITGRLCVERAQSLVHPVWGTFTDAIYFKANNPDDAYQQQRQLGHIRKWDTFRGKPRVYAPSKYHDDVTILESRAHNFATSHAQTHASVSDYVNSGEQGKLTSHETRQTKSAERKLLTDRINIGVCTTMDQVKELLRRVFNRTLKPQDFKKKGGYELTGRLTRYYKRDAESLTADDRLTEEKYRRIAKATNISSTGNGQQYMIYPVYPTMFSAPNEVKYYVHYLPAETN